MPEINVDVNDVDEAGLEFFIIDCDPGIDDAAAILLALDPKLAKNVKVLGITCVGGNTTVDNVVKNALRTLKIANRTDVPIFKGASSAIIPRSFIKPSLVHGHDGFGGVGHLFPVTDEEIGVILQKENAVDWIGRTVLKHPGKITLVALGPLTNVAFTHRLFPDFHSKLKRLVIMGGNTNARGNMGFTAEFNFGCDPEAAHMILDEFTCPITLIPFDTCIAHGMNLAWYEKVVNNPNSVKADFIGKISKAKNDHFAPLLKNYAFYSCDWLAMLCAINPGGLNLQTISHCGMVELDGRLTRGQLVVDWRNALCNAEGEKRKLQIVTQFNQEKIYEFFEKMLL